jgi:hypothetical protein
MDVLVGQSCVANETQAHLKCGMIVDSKDKNSRMRKWVKKKDDPSEDMKKVIDTIDFSFPEELIRYLKFMKI